MIGQMVEHYKVLEEIGQGGMAVVYRALDTRLNREVAIKILHPHLMRQEEAVERFQREAHTVAKLHHPNTIEIYDYSGENSVHLFIVTEFIDGDTFGAYLEKYGAVPCELAACIGRELTMALAHAHKEGIVHRDLKPENVMIRKDGKVKLMDFGIARVLEGSTLTMTGTIMGSPAFMSPEHVTGEAVDARSDLFSMGAILYLIATGALPFQGQNPHATLKNVVDGNYLPPQQVEPTISNGFARMIDKLLETDAEKRYQSAELLLKDLERIIQEAGIEQAGKEVHCLFNDPVNYPETFNKRLITHLEKKARKTKNPATAMQIYGRLIEISPDHPEATRRIEMLAAKQRQRGRIRNILLAGGAALLFLIAVWVAIRHHEPGHVPDITRHGINGAVIVPPVLPDKTLEAPSEEQPRIVAGAGNSKSSIPKELKGKRDRRLSIKKNPGEDPAGKIGETDEETPPPPMNFSGSLQVFSSPWSEIYIDDIKVGSLPFDAKKKFSLKAGKHTVKLLHPNCVPLVERISIDKPGKQIVMRRRLQLLPASLEIVNDQNAMIFVNDDFKGRSPLKKPIRVTWGELKAKKKVLVSLTKRGYESAFRQLVLEAGKTERVELALRKRK